MQRYVIAAAVAVALLAWSAPGAAAQTTQSVGCRWVGEGGALLCDDTGGSGPTLSTWQGGGWTTVPAGAGASLPAVAGGLSTYGSSYPPSHVTPATGYYSESRTGNTLSQTGVLYGPGRSSHALNCTTSFWGNALYRACR
jgi:hypothetical protein